MNKVYQWLATDRWFSPGNPVASTNKTDRNDITEILLIVALSTINQPSFASLSFLIKIKKRSILGFIGFFLLQDTKEAFYVKLEYEKKIWIIAMFLAQYLVGVVSLIFFLAFCVVFLLCLSTFSVLCAQCSQCLWIVHSWLPLRFSLTCIN